MASTISILEDSWVTAIINQAADYVSHVLRLSDCEKNAGLAVAVTPQSSAMQL